MRNIKNEIILLFVKNLLRVIWTVFAFFSPYNLGYRASVFSVP